MKEKILLLFFAATLSITGHCQTNAIQSTGNVGIGTMNPVTALHLLSNSTSLSNSNFITIDNRGNDANYTTSHVVGGLLFAGYRDVRNPANIAGIWSVRTSLANGWASGGDLVFGAADNYGSNITTDNILPTERMRILANGRVGIGTATPASLFDVFGQTAGGNVDINFRNQPGVNTSGTRTNLNFPVFNGASGLQIAEMTASFGGFNVGNYDALISTGQGGSYLHFAAGSARTPQVTLKFNGDVGIGTTTPAAKLDINGTTYSRKLYVGTPDGNTPNYMNSNNFLLAVNGPALFTKAIVKLYTNWPDYVFKPGYQLPKLDSLEQFIKSNGHLPEIPKAETVEKDGIDLGNNQALLLKKIEELTLIAIGQNKQTESLQKIVEAQNKEAQKLEKIVEEQNKRIEELEAHLKKHL